ncbi:MAG: hypothetical protein C0599_10275 [Salinivirgaceae bacterium]|nr:MAG: hypothetical protein C0599_10275 [Salinivirgaceae bacterium]
MKIKLIAFALLAAGLILSCEKEEDSITDKLTEKSFTLINHCDPYGFVKFESDGGGHLFFDQTCEYGYECDYVLPFDWSLSGNSLTVTYLDNSATMICDELSFDPMALPSPETVTFNSGTTILVLQGLTFKK